MLPSLLTPLDIKQYVSSYMKNGTILDSPTLAPNPADKYEKILVIHPGSTNTRVGRASEAFPKQIPNLLLRKTKKAKAPDVELTSPQSGVMDIDEIILTRKKSKLCRSGFHPEVDDSAENLERIGQELEVHVKNRKIKAIYNAAEQVLNYNTQSIPAIFNDHNDSYKVDWIKEEAEFFVGKDVFRVPPVNPDKDYTYKVIQPILNGLLNSRDYTSLQACLNDFEIILTHAIKNELSIPVSDFHLTT